MSAARPATTSSRSGLDWITVFTVAAAAAASCMNWFVVELINHRFKLQATNRGPARLAAKTVRANKSRYRAPPSMHMDAARCVVRSPVVLVAAAGPVLVGSFLRLTCWLSFAEDPR